MNPEPSSNHEKTVLVTGGSGFLGGHSVFQLLKLGYRVRTTVRDLSKERAVRDAVGASLRDPADLSFFEADLGGDQGWSEAVAGCDYVLHIASPFPAAQPKDPQELIAPARDGALRVLEAGLGAGVRRVVMTSSTAAIRGGSKDPKPEPYTEADWTDPDLPGATPYVQSKTLAERAAWEMVESRSEKDRLTVVNPSAILGPVLGQESSSSLEIFERMISGMPGVPRLAFGFVDVRDVADLHIRAMDSDEAGGQRFIASGPSLWLSEVAGILRKELPVEAAKAPRRIIPNPVIRLMSLFDPAMRTFTGSLGKISHFSARHAGEVLGWKARPIEETVADCGRSIAERQQREN